MKPSPGHDPIRGRSGHIGSAECPKPRSAAEWRREHGGGAGIAAGLEEGSISRRPVATGGPCPRMNESGWGWWIELDAQT